ncbi:MAG: hypothetical protein WC495_04705 [Patescibacteria group bacterium]
MEQGAFILKILTIACLGSGLGEPGESQYESMREIGRLIAEAGHIVMTGGYTGIGMEAPAMGATEVGGQAVGVTLLKKPGNGHLSSCIDCSTIGKVSLSLEQQFGLYLGTLLGADRFVIASGGGLGTLAELIAILNLLSKHWQTPKKVVVLQAGYSGLGWDQGMIHLIAHWCNIPIETFSTIYFVQRPEQAARIAIA